MFTRGFLAIIFLSTQVSFAETSLTKEEELDRWTRNYMITVPSVILAYGLLVWDWGENDFRFNYGTEGWFAKSTYSGGADKVGHLNATYIITRISTQFALDAGHSKNKAQLLGIYSAAIVGLGIEIGDGFSRFRFSPEDIVVDALGIFFGWALERYPKLDKLFAIRWQWWPSHEYRRQNPEELIDIFGDYNGQKTFFTLKMEGVPYLNENIITKYMTFDVGFYTRGYKPDPTPNNIHDNVRRQNISFGIGLNLTKVFFDTNPGSKTHQVLSSITKYWIPPQTTHNIHRLER
jgi:hypothetical protein